MKKFASCWAALACAFFMNTAFSANTQLLIDDFDGNTLDTSIWDIVGVNGGIQVSGGFLEISGLGSDHKRIVSDSKFVPNGENIIGRASIRLGGDYQKFGFNLNSTPGFYFDTFSRSEDIGIENNIYAVSRTPSGGVIEEFRLPIPVNWYEFHDFSIEWTISKVTFFIDGIKVAETISPLDPLPPYTIGIFNDRSDLMRTDYVIVEGVIPPLALSCEGFEPPMANGPVTVKKNRALPLKAELSDPDSNAITATDISASPVVQVLYTSGIGAVPEDVTDDALNAGAGTDGNQFEYDPNTGKWQFNLKTKNYDAPGTYTITMVSGDESEYLIDPTCSASFVVE